MKIKYTKNFKKKYLKLPNFAEKASPVSVSVRGGDESVILKKHYLFERIFGMILIGSFEGRVL